MWSVNQFLKSIWRNQNFMDKRPLPSSLTVAQLSQRAKEYREMACGATAREVRDALNKLAIRFALLAASREVSGSDPKCQLHDEI